MSSKKIRVAHLINFLSPAGKEMGIVKLLNGMDGSVFEPILIVFDRVFDTLNLNRQKTKLITLNKKEGNDPGLILKLSKVFRKEKIDILHSHSWGTLVEGILAAKLAGVPVILHGEHGTFHKDFKRRLIQRLLFNLSDQVLSVSELLANQLSESIGIKRDKIITILNGVDVTKFKPDAEKRTKYRQELKADRETILIGTVGRPMKVKNHQLMIRALAELKKKHFKARFLIIGDTPKYSLIDELRQLTRDLNLNNDVQFLGYRKDIPGYLNAFDIFVLPSLSEGCSNVIQEAMATGLPVVASKVGGTPELIEHQRDGLLFTSNSVGELTEALQFLIENPQKARELGRNALQKAREKFSLPVMIKNYENLYLHWMKKNGNFNA